LSRIFEKEQKIRQSGERCPRPKEQHMRRIEDGKGFQEFACIDCGKLKKALKSLMFHVKRWCLHSPL
jgi:hypothetical protein